MERLPLFPLRTPLFPGMELPLRIFEERYKLMIDRCLEEGAPFGVALIRSGEEVGGPAEPHDVGCTARVVTVQRFPDGRMNLVALGERRFRIAGLDTTEPYLAGDVELLASEGGGTPEAADAAGRVAALFAERCRLVLSITGQWVRGFELPDEPDALADHVAARMEASPLVKQELLEALSVPVRLRREAELLDETIRTLTARWEEEQRKKVAGPVLN